MSIFARNLGGCLVASSYSQPDSLYLTQCNFVLCSIIKFGCSRRLMAGYLLGVLEPSVVLQVNSDICRVRPRRIQRALQRGKRILYVYKLV